MIIVRVLQRLESHPLVPRIDFAAKTYKKLKAKEKERECDYVSAIFRVVTPDDVLLSREGRFVRDRRRRTVLLQVNKINAVSYHRWSSKLFNLIFRLVINKIESFPRSSAR